MTVAVVVVIGVVLGFVSFYLKSLHNNFLFWLVSVFIRNLAGFLDL